MRTTRRKPDWAIALVMLVGGLMPSGLILVLGEFAAWAAVTAGLLFWPFAFTAAVFFTWDDDV